MVHVKLLYSTGDVELFRRNDFYHDVDHIDFLVRIWKGARYTDYSHRTLTAAVRRVSRISRAAEVV